MSIERRDFDAARFQHTLDQCCFIGIRRDEDDHRFGITLVGFGLRLHWQLGDEVHIAVVAVTETFAILGFTFRAEHMF